MWTGLALDFEIQNLNFLSVGAILDEDNRAKLTHRNIRKNLIWVLAFSIFD